jgi:ABC-type transport system substrate-binding protein
MRHHPTRTVLLAAAIASALLAGCGASSGSDAADGPTTSVARSTAPEGSSTTTEPDGTTTTEATTTTAATPTGDDGICAPLKDLREADAESSKLVASGDWTAIKAFYVDKTDDIVAIYDEAIGFDSAITPELETLRSVTVSAGDLAAASSDLMDFSGKLIAQPELSASTGAALKANEFATKTCGFGLAGG